VSVDDLRHLFWDDPQKILVGRKAEMVLELVKMLYFDYCLEFEVWGHNALCGMYRQIARPTT